MIRRNYGYCPLHNFPPAALEKPRARPAVATSLAPLSQHAWQHSRCLQRHGLDLVLPLGPRPTHHVTRVGTLHEYYSHISSHMLWTRAAANRKELRGTQNGVDKATTLQLLRSRTNEYDRGVLRSTLACAMYTQSIRYQNKQTDRPVCPFCWSAHEDHLHLFWHCAAWSHPAVQIFPSSRTT